MDSKDFLEKVKCIVANDYNNRFKLHLSLLEKNKDSVFVAWSCKILQNNKALAGVYGDNSMYYEVTYNGDKNEFYIDEYYKTSNTKIEG